MGAKKQSPMSDQALRDLARAVGSTPEGLSAKIGHKFDSDVLARLGMGLMQQSSSEDDERVRSLKTENRQESGKQSSQVPPKQAPPKTAAEGQGMAEQPLPTGVHATEDMLDALTEAGDEILDDLDLSKASPEVRKRAMERRRRREELRDKALKLLALLNHYKQGALSQDQLNIGVARLFPEMKNNPEVARAVDNFAKQNNVDLASPKKQAQQHAATERVRNPEMMGPRSEKEKGPQNLEEFLSKLLGLDRGKAPPSQSMESATHRPAAGRGGGMQR